jgi:ethanolamine-phosphate cytidylyltransferase
MKKEGRSYIDGAFDLVHSGHFNAIRQAHAICENLVIGVNSDEDILAVKGPTVFNVEERTMILKACKWATEVESPMPYTVSEELLDKLNCQHYIHGDDPCYDAQGVELCGYFKKLGRFKMI